MNTEDTPECTSGMRMEYVEYVAPFSLLFPWSGIIHQDCWTSF